MGSRRQAISCRDLLSLPFCISPSPSCSHAAARHHRPLPASPEQAPWPHETCKPLDRGLMAGTASIALYAGPCYDLCSDAASADLSLLQLFLPELSAWSHDSLLIDRPTVATDMAPPHNPCFVFRKKKMNQDPDYWWPPCRDALGDGKAKQDATSACLLSPSAQLSPRPHPRPSSSIIQLPSLPLLLDLFPFPQQHCSFSFFISLVCSSFVYKEPSFHSRDQSHSLSLAQPS